MMVRCQLDFLACGREAEVLKELHPPPIIVVLFKRFFLRFAQPARQAFATGHVIHLSRGRTTVTSNATGTPGGELLQGPTPPLAAA